jgi:tripartite-type tricarboxylate transporter receptor subunit TctC
VANHFLVFSRIFVTPPGVPDNVYEAWRKAFEQTTRDPGFLKAAEVAGLDVGLGTAEDFRDSLSKFDSLTPGGRKLFKDLVGQ